VSADGTNYTVVTTGVLSNADGAQTVPFGGNVARYVKLCVTNGYLANYWELGEFELYGTPAPGGVPAKASRRWTPARGRRR